MIVKSLRCRLFTTVGHPGRIANFIEYKPEFIVEYNEQCHSETLAEVNEKALILYREACRRMQYMLQSFQILPEVTAVQARINLASHFRRYQHVRNVDMLDRVVTRGWETLRIGAWHYTYWHAYKNYIMPYNIVDNRGFSLVDDTRYKNKSEFMKDFYDPIQPEY